MTTDGNTPDGLLYAPSHEWLRRDPSTPNQATVGITDFAQDQLGDVVYVELPDPGSPLTAGEVCAEIESTKTVAEVYAPVNGEVVAANTDLEDSPELVNDSPYGDGWLFRVKIAAGALPEGLLDAAAYQAQLDEN